MKKISVLLPICAALALSGCFMSQKSQIVHRDVPYNAQNQARLRIYGQYGRDVVRMIPNSTCEQWAEKQGRRRHTRFTCRAVSATFPWACLPPSAATP